MDNEETLRPNQNDNQPVKAGLEAVYPWKKAWETAKVIWPQLVYISLVCMSIPQYLLFVFSTRKAFEYGERFNLNSIISLEKGIEVLADFAKHYVSVGWIVLLLFLLGVFTAVALCAQVSQGEEVSGIRATRTAARVLFPRGLVFMVASVLGLLLALNISVQLLPQSMWKFAAFILAVLITALPALMLLEPKRPTAAFKNALRMQYASFSGMSKWSVFFLLLTYLLLALNFIALIEWAGASLLYIDVPLQIARDSIHQSNAGWPFGTQIYIVEAFYTLFMSFIVLAFIVLNSTFVFELYRRHCLGRTISVAV